MALRPDSSSLEHRSSSKLNSNFAESDISNNSLLFLSLTQSRQAWTTALFRPFVPSISQDNNASTITTPITAKTTTSIDHEADGASSHNGHVLSKEPELVGSCTVVIGPHMFPDTRFFRVPCQPATATVGGMDSHGDTAMTEASTDTTGVNYQLVFEFRENPTDRWLLPDDAVIEALTMSAPYEIIATFCLPRPNGDILSKSPGQHITMHFSEVSEELWQAIRAASGDQEQAIQRLVKDIQVNLDEALGPMHMAFDKPPTLADILGTRIGNDDRIALYDSRYGHTSSISPAKLSKTPKKRTSDASQLSTPDNRRSAKKPKSAGTSPKKARKSTAAGGTALHDTNNMTTPNTTGTKKCMYCNCKNTPMWRRGPQGAGTLCNACGVKWKHGKILQGVTSSPGNSGGGGGGSNHSTGARSASSSPTTADDNDRKHATSKITASTPHSRSNHNSNDTRSPLAPLQREVGKTSSSPESEAGASSILTKKSASTSGTHNNSAFVPAPLKKRFSIPGKER